MMVQMAPFIEYEYLPPVPDPNGCGHITQFSTHQIPSVCQVMNSQHDPYLKMNPIAGQVITNKNSVNLDNLVSTWALAHTFTTTLFPTYLPGTRFKVLDKDTVS